MAISEWFSTFCGNLCISQTKRSDIAYRTNRIATQLNYDFRGIDSGTANRFYVGSYGRKTAIPSVSDLDLLYVLPSYLHTTYSAYQGNGQSSLLAAVRNSVLRTYPASNIGGDGQIVYVGFSDGTHFEVLPAFHVNDGYTFPDSNGGGSWKVCWPKQEMDAFSSRDTECNGNLMELGRMARAWRDTNNVPMSGMLIDTLAYQFMGTWPNRGKSYLWYDFLTRDFFAYLAQQNADKNYWQAPGSGSYVYRKGLFEYRARQAELRCNEAIVHQQADRNWSACQKYREIYGTAFPS